MACPYIPQVMRTTGNVQLFSTVKCQKIQPERLLLPIVGKDPLGLLEIFYVLEHGRHATVQLTGWRH